MQIRLLGVALVALLIAGCEETAPITGTIYRERLVVYSVLDAGWPIKVRFTKTLPIDQQYSESAAALDDVDATITVMDSTSGAETQTISLRYAGNGWYEIPPTVTTVQQGLRYRLNAAWRGRTVSAETSVPRSARIDTVYLATIPPQREWEDTSRQIRAVVYPRAGETYLVTSADFDPRTNELQMRDTYGGARLLRARDKDERGRIELVDFFWSYPPGEGPDMAVIVSYDEAYYEFQETFYQHTDRGPFGSGADIVRWNIVGDGIGLFIGRTYTQRRL